MPNWKKVIVSGSDASLNSLNVVSGSTITGSLNTTGSVNISGSLNVSNTVGTTAFSTNADQLTFTGSIFTSGSFSATGSLSVFGGITGSLLGTSSYATTASYWSGSITNALSASYALISTSASYATNALTASFALNGGGGGTSALYILDEGNTQGSASYLDFVGAGVTATVTNGTASINIPGGGGSSQAGGNSVLSQSAANVTWSFTHNLNTQYPVFTIFDSNNDVIIPQRINAVNTSSALIYFSSPRTGYAVASQGGNVTSASYALVAISASYANNATSASYAASASNALAAQTASYVQTAITASYVQNATTASYILNAVSSSYAASASNALAAQSSSYALTASYSANVPVTSSYANNAASASYALTASYSANVPVTSSYANNAASASYSLTASYAANVPQTASYAISASNALTASYAANVPLTSSYAITASYSLYALTASNAPGYTVQFTQSAAAATWSFTHNLNTRNPIVQVYDSSYKQIIPNDIIGTGVNTAEIRFDYATTGYVVMSNGGGLYVTGSTSQLTQTSAAVTWSFTHNLNSKYIAFETYDSSDNVIIPAGIHVIDTNSAELYFAIATSGIAIAQFSGINGAPNATTASYALTATSASYAVNATSASYAINATTASYLNPIVSSYVVLTQVSQSLNFVDDAAAAAGGVPLGGLYRNGNFILIRIS